FRDPGSWWRRLGAADSARQKTAPALSAIGKPVLEWDAYELGVHYPIAEEGRTDLPDYFSRQEDAELRDLLKRCESHTAMLIVTGQASRHGYGGDSCIGKSRTLYEAVRSVFPTRTMVRPDRDSPELLAILEEERLPDR